MRSVSRVRVDHEQGATFVELFFDLVFVYAITQLTATVLHDLTWTGVGHAALLFWLVWWSWTQFTWTLNLADTEYVWVRFIVLCATAVAFFLAQAVPDAYTTAGLWFAVSYVVVRLLGLALQELVHQGDAFRFTAISRWTRLSMIGLVLVIVGGLVSGDLRIWFWLGALVADLMAASIAGSGSWTLAPGHFVERHGLIVIIALGESLIAAGVATSELTRDMAFAATTSGAVVAACALWWTYFSSLHTGFESAMAAENHATLGRFARDVFSFWHALTVAGVIGIAVAFEQAVAHPSDALGADGALALTLGVLLFVGGVTGAAVRAKLDAQVAPRIALLVIVLASTPLLPSIPAAISLWGLAILVIVLAILETPQTIRTAGSAELSA